MVAALAVLGLTVITGDESGAVDAMQLLLVPLGSPAPEFQLPGIGGRTRGLSSTDLKNDVSLVNVFASWCVPCRDEHPLLTALADQEVAPIYGLNYKDDPEIAQRWLDRLGNPYAGIGSDRDGRVAEEWGLYGLPQTFVIDPTGRTAFVHTGVLNQSVVDEAIVPLISRLRAEAAVH
jgi:cytochrome c biogenesis protein CcmG/thiol:disulfide interchange protein DsbE